MVSSIWTDGESFGTLRRRLEGGARRALVTVGVARGQRCQSQLSCLRGRDVAQATAWIHDEYGPVSCWR